MLTMNDVLYVPIVTQMQPITILTRDLFKVVDEESCIVFEQLLKADVIDDSSSNIKGLGIMDLEKDVSFSKIPHLITDDGFDPVSPNHCIYFLSTLKGKKSTDLRHTFFQSGKIMLSTVPILIDEQFYYLAIGQNQSENKSGQHPFSIRLFAPPKIFLHSLYQVLVTKVQSL